MISLFQLKFNGQTNFKAYYFEAYLDKNIYKHLQDINVQDIKYMISILTTYLTRLLHKMPYSCSWN